MRAQSDNQRRHQVQHAPERRPGSRLLPRHLAEVGDRLQQAVRPHPVGPWRTWKPPISLRSTHVMIANNTITRLISTRDLMAVTMKPSAIGRSSARPAAARPMYGTAAASRLMPRRRSRRDLRPAGGARRRASRPRSPWRGPGGPRHRGEHLDAAVGALEVERRGAPPRPAPRYHRREPTRRKRPSLGTAAAALRPWARRPSAWRPRAARPARARPRLAPARPTSTSATTGGRATMRAKTLAGLELGGEARRRDAR